jgi:hypothetical protein
MDSLVYDSMQFFRSHVKHPFSFYTDNKKGRHPAPATVRKATAGASGNRRTEKQTVECVETSVRQPARNAWNVEWAAPHGRVVLGINVSQPMSHFKPPIHCSFLPLRTSMCPTIVTVQGYFDSTGQRTQHQIPNM